MFVIQRNDGKFVARRGAAHSYTTKLQEAEQYPNYASAECSCCGNEHILAYGEAAGSRSLNGLNPAMVFPIVNLNGSSKESLLAMGMAAYDSLDQSLKYLCEMRPHGRDYQLSPPEHYRIAQDQHEMRIRKVREARDEIKAYLLAISEQGS